MIDNDILKSKKGKSMTYLMSTLMHEFLSRNINIPRESHITCKSFNKKIPYLMLCGWLILLLTKKLRVRIC
ncbi:hypothetical protein RCL_jg8974.t1 [Rhizophagus clarus]|uniref:Uncharacterized protein n=1 Tax=Rhizophagus clarus TaxID=94130 RepID=A0A8H3KWB7_9GLOM|nr:hypothetical protein RCL_jg8974.t1 [Rhizophagus clarus]